MFHPSFPVQGLYIFDLFNTNNNSKNNNKRYIIMSRVVRRSGKRTPAGSCGRGEHPGAELPGTVAVSKPLAASLFVLLVLLLLPPPPLPIRGSGLDGNPGDRPGVRKPARGPDGRPNPSGLLVGPGDRNGDGRETGAGEGVDRAACVCTPAIRYASFSQ